MGGRGVRDEKEKRKEGGNRGRETEWTKIQNHSYFWEEK